jgi:hypothetical protein
MTSRVKLLEWKPSDMVQTHLLSSPAFSTKKKYKDIVKLLINYLKKKSWKKMLLSQINLKIIYILLKSM